MVTATGNSHLVGYIICPYVDLVAAYGKPSRSRYGKSLAEWTVNLPGVGAAYIYDFGRHAYGEVPRVEEIVEWHVGAESDAVMGPICEQVRDASGHAPVVLGARFSAEWVAARDEALAGPCRRFAAERRRLHGRAARSVEVFR